MLLHENRGLTSMHTVLRLFSQRAWVWCPNSAGRAPAAMEKYFRAPLRPPLDDIVAGT